MSLPSNDELREMIERASPYPWQKEWGFITPSEREPGRLLADLGGAYGDVYPRKEDTGLMLIAPQLAEEVIRLRDEINRVKEIFLDWMASADTGVERANAERENAFQEGQWEAFFEIWHQMVHGPGGDE